MSKVRANECYVTKLSIIGLSRYNRLLISHSPAAHLAWSQISLVFEGAAGFCCVEHFSLSLKPLSGRLSAFYFPVLSNVVFSARWLQARSIVQTNAAELVNKCQSLGLTRSRAFAHALHARMARFDWTWSAHAQCAGCLANQYSAELSRCLAARTLCFKVFAALR